MEADRTAPVYGTGDIEVAADPEAIGGVLGDIGSWPAWTPDITGATLQGPVPGTTFRWKSGPGTITSTFQVVDGPTKLTWTGKTHGRRYELSAGDPGCGRGHHPLGMSPPALGLALTLPRVLREYGSITMSAPGPGGRMGDHWRPVQTADHRGPGLGVAWR